jgi:hypothetical protein
MVPDIRPNLPQKPVELAALRETHHKRELPDLIGGQFLMNTITR